jgi:hypothetical protein
MTGPEMEEKLRAANADFLSSSIGVLTNSSEPLNI